MNNSWAGWCIYYYKDGHSTSFAFPLIVLFKHLISLLNASKVTEDYEILTSGEPFHA